MKSILSGALLDIALNIFMIGNYFYARSIFSLQPGWRELYRLYFSTLLPFEFRRLLKLSDVVVVEQFEPSVIVASGDHFQALYFVIDGAADLVVDGHTASARLQRGDWIAEFSMLTGKPASADVLATSLRLLSWKAAAIGKLKLSMPAVFEKVNALIARNLCDKLVRANRSANQVLAEQSG
ncbi:MAG: cyclic nucleotide-binding domain-containing protein [Cyanobacteria bacterium M_surface_9_m1_291]|nr:cyclic nucleotide-binding domain-containing protein [Cyanobacteria bacterium M_surface_9_m1_291]